MPPRQKMRTKPDCRLCTYAKNGKCTVGEKPYTVVRDKNLQAHIEFCEMFDERKKK